MRLLLLSGGSGKRLWPLSNNMRSKQFLKVLRNSDGTLESMVQRVWYQLNKKGLSQSTYVTTNRGQYDSIISQLGSDIRVIIEPMSRDTFPAIALAATYLHCEENADREESIIVLPVDPYVEDHFFDKVKELDRILQSTDAQLALIGVTPTFPSEKYGYIVPELINHNHEFLRVDNFEEKPFKVRAEELIKKNALWNCGVFGFKLGKMLELIKGKNLPTDYRAFKKIYSDLPKNSFDYEVVEKLSNIIAVKYDGYWKDLGTWNTLTEEMDTQILGNGRQCNESVNTHIINELDIPVVVLGGSNLVVAASADGILVSDKDSSPKLKDIIHDINQRPMFEERRWGWYKVLDYEKYPNGQEVLIKRVCIEKGKNLSYHHHKHRSEVWNVVSGEGELILDGKQMTVKKGETIEIPSLVKHSIYATTTLEFIEIQQGEQVTDEDTYRTYKSWDEIKRNLF